MNTAWFQMTAIPEFVTCQIDFENIMAEYFNGVLQFFIISLFLNYCLKDPLVINQFLKKAQSLINQLTYSFCRSLLWYCCTSNVKWNIFHTLWHSDPESLLQRLHKRSWESLTGIFFIVIFSPSSGAGLGQVTPHQLCMAHVMQCHVTSQASRPRPTSFIIRAEFRLR